MRDRFSIHRIKRKIQNHVFVSYASKADLYELTMHLARHFWNTCRTFIKRKLERSLLFDPLNELIHHINTVAPKSIISSRNEKETVEIKIIQSFI